MFVLEGYVHEVPCHFFVELNSSFYSCVGEFSRNSFSAACVDSTHVMTELMGTVTGVPGTRNMWVIGDNQKGPEAPL
jgi:hypothetical protein